MAIRLYNTKTRQKEDFVPIDPKDVRMYVCGPTVYDRAHIGNARPVVVFDVLYRLLRHEYGEAHVQYARNFTDVDDKINAKAAETGRSIRDITDETIGWYHEDMDALGALRPDHEPRATEYIAQMVAMIEELIARGNAYAAEGPADGKHVLFAVATDPDYGTLSRRSLDEMRAGARVEVAPYKRDPMDFVLWKPSDATQPGWDSPWGKGRPGWHIECSAMAGELFGERFDIHGGGIDLAFPHHENECAQSRCAGHDFASVWMHNGYLMVEGEKMSKSLGNFFTVADLRAEGHKGYEIRMALLMSQYTDPLDWTEKRTREARQKVSRWRRAMSHFDGIREGNYYDIHENDNSIFRTLCDNLNTSLAVEMTDKAARSLIDETIPKEIRTVAAGMFDAGISVLGFEDMIESEYEHISEEMESSFRTSSHRYEHDRKMASSLIENLLFERQKSKEMKDFQKADKIRDLLVKAGVDIKDTAQGSKWSLKPTFTHSKLPKIDDV